MVVHSDKVKATVAALGLADAVWTMPPTLWVEEEREVMGEVTCPVCDGEKLVIRDADGKLMTFPDRYGKDSNAARNALMAMFRRKDDGACHNCLNRAGRALGTVKALVRRKVKVGYLQWPTGTVYDSRYFASDCMACGKNNIKSGLAPMMAQDANGIWHGMWVGYDCARKFFALSAEKQKELTSPDVVLDR